MKILISIVPKHDSQAVASITGGGIIQFQTVIPGLGTATSEILDYFCLGETDRDVILSLVDDNDIEPIFSDLKEKLDFLHSGRGVAFTISVDSISKLGYNFLYHKNSEDN
jgi:hypothetical protein